MNFWATLPRPIIGLSPMDGVTDASFRHVVAIQGKPDVSFTEFTHVHDVCRGPEFLLDSLIYDEIERPIVAQLYGKDPDLFYQAAHAVCALGFDGLDINMGCPSRNVASSGSGAGLIRTPDLARTIIQATRQGIDDWVGGQSMESAGIKPARAEAIHRMNQRRGSMPGKRRSIPVSVKTRLGYDEVIVEHWVEHLITEHPCAISLHGRTLQQMYRGQADWEAIARAAQVVKGTGILLFGNGDVQNLTEVVQRVRETRVDGVLIGRGALGAPWLFREKERARLHLHQDTPMVAESSVLPLSERFQVLLEHARHFEHVHGVSQFRRMRKHLGWYCTGFPHAAALRASMFRLSSVAGVEQVLLDYRVNHTSDTSTVPIKTSLDPEEALTLPVSRCG
ncbi:tRNA-dihydrouridine synthase [Nitrospira sp. KM1]|uniref:tRNA dihydrouridine synthase n=1 Tax=Nitrospira sp. KM1 TaxID=1936990 RepID=UPI0013A7180B|nr:tRNA-dihydrouridine synthase [Nitrospira sp. KM1]BCA54835.1 tRNA-dihydrouridine synthase [Nitrospira sp. KM1]